VNYDGTGKRLPQGEEINYLKIDVKGIRYYYSQDRSKMLWAELNNIYVSNKDLSGKWQLNKDAGYMNIRLYFNPMWDRRDNKIYYYLDHYSEFTGDNRGIMEINADGSGERMILGLEPLGIEFTGNYWYTSNLDISFDIFNK
jgi:hypothetical protein